jgi:hypothetical protein
MIRPSRRLKAANRADLGGFELNLQRFIQGMSDQSPEKEPAYALRGVETIGQDNFDTNGD